VLAGATAALEPPLVAGRRLKLMYVTQVSTAPPRIAIFSNLERDIPTHYRRYLEARFRAALGLQEAGTPFRIEFRRAGKSRSEGARPVHSASPASRRRSSHQLQPESEG
jgi:GTP-binding protein